MNPIFYLCVCFISDVAGINHASSGLNEKSNRMIKAYISFYLKNYLRSHRYLRELILIILFNIIFSGFLYTSKPEDMVWTVFGVFGILLTMVSVPSIFFLEKGHSLHFGLIYPNGRRNFFLAKYLLILGIDFLWIVLFTGLYGLKFMDPGYFKVWLVRLFLMLLLMGLSVALLSLSFTYRPSVSWLILILIVFGGIVNKSALFPIHSVKEFYAPFTFILPPILEIIYGGVTLEFPLWRSVFLVLALIQLGIFLFFNLKLMSKKDLV